MSTSLYDISIPNYLQTLGGVAQTLDKGAAHAAEKGIDLDDLVNARLCDDMKPLSFQVIACWHQSLGAIRGLEAGEFSPPPKLPDLDYAGLRGLVQEATDGLGQYSADDVNAMEGKDMAFRMPGLEMPFTAEDFIMSFALPNFYFHATAAYCLLRMNGAPLGKADFLGALRVSG